MTARYDHPIRFVIIFLIITVLLSACAPAAAPTQAPVYDLSNSVAAPAAPPMERKSVAQPGALPAQGGSSTITNEYAASDNPAAQQIDRMIVKNANLTIVVSDPGKSMDVISKMADELGGFVVTANMAKEYSSNGIEVPHATITIRVPAGRLNEALLRIKGESKQDPLTEGINSQDVTGEYVDLQSQLKNLEAAEAQLTEIMGSATKTEDVLNVYNQLVQVRGQIEQTKGRMKYLEQTSALSAISTDLVADKAVQPIKIGGWQPVGIAKTAVETLISTFQILASIFIWLVIYILPVLAFLYLVIVLPITLLLRARKRRRAARLSPTIPPAPPTQEG